MEGGRITSKFLSQAKKYRYVLPILLLGIFFMCIPERKAPENTSVTQARIPAEPDVQLQLEEILSQIQGAGKVKVLLTQAYGEQTIYQADHDTTPEGAVRTETIIITGTEKNQQGLVAQVNPPVYLGAIVVCQGADSAVIRLAIVEAVSKATGLSADRITVLKMK